MIHQGNLPVVECFGLSASPHEAGVNPWSGSWDPTSHVVQTKQQNRESIKIADWAGNSVTMIMAHTPWWSHLEIMNSTSENENTDFSLPWNLFNFSKTSFVILITNLNVISFTVFMAFTLYIYYFFFGFIMHQGSNPHPLHWKCRVLTTGLPRNSLYIQICFGSSSTIKQNLRIYI